MKAHWRKCPNESSYDHDGVHAAAVVGTIRYPGEPANPLHTIFRCGTCGGLGKIRVRAKRKRK